MHEAAFGFPPDQEMSEDDLGQQMAALVAEHGDAVMAAYRDAYPTLSAKDRFILAATDRSFRVNAAVMAERKLEGGTAGVWSYIFAAPNQAGYSPHGMELAYHFELIGPVGMAVDSPHHRGSAG